jgi:23S rRNA (uridine2552-2'-O)-methyltransferase
MRFSVGSLTKKGSVSSHLWKQRQACDPFVAARDEQGFVARSAFKLREIESKFPGTLRRGGAVLDLGAAPGSWTQMAVTSGCRVVACDLLPHQLSSSVAGQVQWLQGDMNR